MKKINFEWALDTKRDGAKSCVLVGKVPKGEIPDGKKYKLVVWFLFKKELNLKKIPHSFNVIYLDETSTDIIDQELTTTILQSFTTLPDLFISNSILSFKTEIYNLVLDKIQLHFETTQRARNTRQEEGFLAQSNTIKNLVDYLTNRLKSNPSKQAKAISAAIVGAGPSLDTSLPALKSIQEHVTIIAVDSSLAILAKAGILPDATVSIDAEKPASQCVPKNMKTGTLFLSSKSPDDWKSIPSKRYYLSGNSLTEDWFEKQGYCKTTIKCTQNCGITAVNIALELGLSNVYLFGMDNAIDEDGSGHASNVNLDISRGSKHNPRGKHPKVKGNYKDEVKTFLKAELHALCELIGNRLEEQNIYNVIDRGAKIEGAVLVHPDNLSSDDVAGTKIDLADHLSTCSTNKEEALDFIRSHTRKIHPQTLNNLKSASDQRGLIASIFQNKSLAGLLGNLFLKHGPQILEWESLRQSERVKISEEIHDCLVLLMDL